MHRFCWQALHATKSGTAAYEKVFATQIRQFDIAVGVQRIDFDVFDRLRASQKGGDDLVIYLRLTLLHPKSGVSGRFRPSRTPFRCGQKLFAFPPERCSPSDRNAVRNHNGMVFGFRPESPVTFTGIPTG